MYCILGWVVMASEPPALSDSLGAPGASRPVRPFWLLLVCECVCVSMRLFCRFVSAAHVCCEFSNKPGCVRVSARVMCVGQRARKRACVRAHIDPSSHLIMKWNRSSITSRPAIGWR